MDRRHENFVEDWLLGILIRGYFGFPAVPFVLVNIPEEIVAESTFRKF